MEKYSPETRERLMKNETSIRAVIPAPKGGAIVTLGFPGLAFDVQGDAYIDPERFAATMGAHALETCKMLIILVERDEVPPEAWDLLDQYEKSMGFQLVHLPIQDYQVPDAVFMAKWHELSPQMDRLMQEGGSIALSCHYGAGRSGTIAARMLIERGSTVLEAINTLREKFPESIESEKQIDWLERCEEDLEPAV